MERRESSAVTIYGSSQAGFEVIAPVTSYAETRKEPRLPCVVLDAVDNNRVFVAQQPILDLIGKELLPSKEKIISSASSGIRQFALCGLGGLGKTAIAVEFARRYKGAFDAVFWVRADAVAKLDESYSDISIKLGLGDESEKRNHVVNRELLKGWLSNPWKGAASKDEALNSMSPDTAEADWLIIFDNADDPYILTDYWPQGSGSVLITSRDPIAKTLFSVQSSGIDLNPLSDEDGASLLGTLTNTRGGEGESVAKKISQALGGLPLAILQMASIIRRQQLDLAEFLDLYLDNTEHLDLHGKRFDSGIRNYPYNISTVWAFERLSVEARALLELISFFDPDAFQEDILTGAPSEVLAKGFPVKIGAYREARTELLQLSLVRRNPQKKELSVHRLVQDAVLAKAGKKSARASLGLTVHLLWAQWPSAMPKASLQVAGMQKNENNKRLVVGRWPICAALYPHVLRLKQLWGSFEDMSILIKLQFVSLLTDAAW